MKRLPLVLLSLTTLAAVVFCLLWQGARRDHSDLVTLARSGAAETCTRFSDYQVHGDDGDYWGGVAAFHTFRQACALLPEQGSDDRAVCSAVYGQLLLHPEGAKAHLPERIAGEDSDSLTVADVQWWRFYGDSTLCRIIERTLDNNRDMLAAAARVERLRELYRVSRAERLPSVTGTAYGDYETNDYAGEKSSRDPGFGAKVTLSWELDLWGNLRWAKRKGGAEYLASVEDRRAMRMTLVASVAAAYFNLIALDNELSIVRRTLITRSEGLYQVQLRFGGGLTSEMVYQQAKVEYASTAALIPDLERKIKIMENGILLLMGENPDRRVVRGKMNTDAEFADSLPVGLPSGLLQRRPDVRSSEQRLRAAMASAGMAYADRFPRIGFNLTGGWENNDVSGFFRSPFSYVAGTLASPVFGFGRKQARYKAALAAYDEARLGYEQKVLTVFKDKTPAEIAAFSLDDIFARLGLEEHLSPSRRNGLLSMIEKIRFYAFHLQE